MNEDLYKDLFSGKREVEITFDESNLYDEIFDLKLTKDYITYVENRLTSVFEQKGVIDRYELFSALGMDLSKVGTIENKDILVREW